MAAGSGSAIASAARITTAGGTVDVSHTNTGTNLTWVGQSKATISAYAVTASTDPAIVAGTAVAHVLDLDKSAGLSVTDFGLWTIDASGSAGAPTYIGVYAGAKPGLTTSNPAVLSGTATYNGLAAGYVATGGGAKAGSVGPWSGSATLTANFASGAISGAITRIDAFALGGGGDPAIGTVNDIALAGTITGATFAGTAQATGPAGSAFDISGASGTLAGAFYGAAGEEAAATFGLAGGANAVTLVGSLGTRATSAPCDRRLKERVRFVGMRPDGVALYSWRYRGSRRRFVGPLAQELARDSRFADTVSVDDDGFLWVDFARIGLPQDLAAMRREGEAAIGRTRRAA